MAHIRFILGSTRWVAAAVGNGFFGVGFVASDILEAGCWTCRAVLRGMAGRHILVAGGLHAHLWRAATSGGSHRHAGLGHVPCGIHDAGCGVLAQMAESWRASLEGGAALGCALDVGRTDARAVAHRFSMGRHRLRPRRHPSGLGTLDWGVWRHLLGGGGGCSFGHWHGSGRAGLKTRPCLDACRGGCLCAGDGCFARSSPHGVGFWGQYGQSQCASVAGQYRSGRKV